MPKITRIVSHLLIINLLMFFGAQVLFDKVFLIEPFGNRTALGLWYPFSDFFRPYQLVTHMFMHSNFSHLFFEARALKQKGAKICF